MNIDTLYRVNYQIKAREVRVIDENGNNVGVMSVNRALALAEDKGLDLVEVGPKANPPVCKIMDYGKYKYQMKKKMKEAKKKQTFIEIKEIKIRPRIEEHDYQVKLKHIRRFLSDGNKAKVMLWMRGRELEHIDRGEAILKRIISETQDIGEVEKPPVRESTRTIVMVLTPKKKK